MRFTSHVIAGCALWVFLLAGIAGAATDPNKDTLQFTVRGAPVTKKGIIKKDSFVGVELAQGPMSFKPKRYEIIKVIYGDIDNKNLDDAIQLMQGGEYKASIQRLMRVLKSISRMRIDAQKPLAKQYVAYYLGMCYYNMGAESKSKKEQRAAITKAREFFNRLVANKADTAFYFEAMLTEARCREFTSRSEAKARYGFLINDFSKKKEDAKVKWAAKYVFLARISELRLTAEDLLKRKDKEREVRDLRNKLNNIVESPPFKKYAGPQERSEAIKIKARLLSYLKEYIPLVKILNASVKDSQRTNDKGALSVLYLTRADSYYALIAQTPDKAQDLRNQAMFDYLRSLEVFKISGDEAAKAHYRTGKLMMDLRIKDWKIRAKYHLKRGQRSTDEKLREAATKLLSEIAAMPVEDA